MIFTILQSDWKVQVDENVASEERMRKLKARQRKREKDEEVVLVQFLQKKKGKKVAFEFSKERENRFGCQISLRFVPFVCVWI